MKLLMMVLVLTCCVEVQAQLEAQRRRNFNTVNFVALREFDPVSYFKGKPLKGNSTLEFKYEGIIYYFANSENLEEFKTNPAKYEPAYGGWCAYTVANTGDRVKVMPTSYKIIDGKLYLFYNFNGDDRLRKWNAGSEKALKAAADKNWIRRMN